MSSLIEGAPKVQVVATTERDLAPGDVFKDADGVLWMAMNPSIPPIRQALLLWHTRPAKVSREGEGFTALSDIPGPYTFVIALREVE